MNNNVIKILLAVVIAGVLALYFKSSFINNTNENPIKIGVILPFTGTGAFWAESAKNAVEIAVSEINRGGGINQRLIEVLYEDNQTNPSQSVTIFQKFANIDKVDVVVGDVWAFLTNPLIPLSATYQTLLISPTVMDASVQGSSDYFFTLGHTVDSMSAAVQVFFDKNPQIKTVAIICSQDTWGNALTKMYEDVLLANNKTSVMKNCTTGFDPDYRIEAAKTKSSNPDAVLINGLGDRAVKVLREMGYRGPILTDSNLIDGFENRDSVSVTQLENVFVIDWHANADFVATYKSLYGTYPIVEAQNSYETIRSIAKAFEANPDNVIEGLKTVQYESVDGYIDFTNSTNINPNKAKASLFIIKGKGNYELIK